MDAPKGPAQRRPGVRLREAWERAPQEVRSAALWLTAMFGVLAAVGWLDQRARGASPDALTSVVVPTIMGGATEVYALLRRDNGRRCLMLLLAAMGVAGCAAGIVILAVQQTMGRFVPGLWWPLLYVTDVAGLLVSVRLFRLLIAPEVVEYFAGGPLPPRRALRERLPQAAPAVWLASIWAFVSGMALAAAMGVWAFVADVGYDEAYVCGILMAVVLAFLGATLPGGSKPGHAALVALAAAYAVGGALVAALEAMRFGAGMAVADAVAFGAGLGVAAAFGALLWLLLSPQTREHVWGSREDEPGARTTAGGG